MDIQQQGEVQYIQSSFETCLQKVKTNSKNCQQPSARIFHSCVSYKSSIFIYGGLLLNETEDFQNQHTFIYRYDANRFEWKKIQVNFPANTANLTSLQNIYSHSCVVYGNLMYLFGGKSGRNGPCTNQMWAIHLDNFTCKKQEQKGLIPEKRQSASLVLINKSSLFLYGGKNQDFFFNDINLYKIESKQWLSIDINRLEFLVSQRIRPAITVSNDVIYIFGGEKQSSVQESFDTLGDFYQIKIIQKATSVRPDLWVSRVKTYLKPGKLVSPKLFTLNDRYLAMIGCQNNPNSNSKVWLFDVQKYRWLFSHIQDPSNFGISIGFSALNHFDRIYLTGGVDFNLKPTNMFSSIYIDCNEIRTGKLDVKDKILCFVCEQETLSLCRRKFYDANLVQEHLRQIEYPFNAFGLLVDNSNLLKSENISIRSQSITKDKYIIIEDDGLAETLWGNQEQFLQDMMKFKTITEQQMEFDNQALDTLQQNIDKINYCQDSPQNQISLLVEKDQFALHSAKKQQQKQEEKKIKKRKQLAKKTKARLRRKRKQFSINIKVGSLRLAKTMIYVSKTSNQTKRVFILEQKMIKINQGDINTQNKQKTDQYEIRYQCHYYIVPAATPSTSSTTTSAASTSSSNDYTRQLLQNQYKTYLKLIDQQSSMKNHLILIDLRQLQNEDGVKQPQLKINTKMNDILLGTNKLISRIQSLNIHLEDSIDISLKRYLSMLYLNVQSTKITMSISSDQSQQIQNSHNIHNIDTLSKSHRIMDLTTAFDLQQCKIVELYYHKYLLDNGKKSTKHTDSKKLFFNGILIYHKNRLIKRYKYPLGQLFKSNQYIQNGQKPNKLIKIFGFIQLDQVFYSNTLKTNIVNQQALENMYSRIKFVQQNLQIKNKLYQDANKNTSLNQNANKYPFINQNTNKNGSSFQNTNKNSLSFQNANKNRSSNQIGSKNSSSNQIGNKNCSLKRSKSDQKVDEDQQNKKKIKID